jgi:hypothetical protein
MCDHQSASEEGNAIAKPAHTWQKQEEYEYCVKGRSQEQRSRRARRSKGSNSGSPANAGARRSSPRSRLDTEISEWQESSFES